MSVEPDFAVQVLDERNALYRLISRALGRLDALDPFGESDSRGDVMIDYQDVAELRQWLTAGQQAILPEHRALTEGASGP